MKTFWTLVAVVASAAVSHAELINANGNVTLVSTTTVFEQGNVTDASDGNTASTPNGQIYTNAPGGGNADYFNVASDIVFDINLGGLYNIDEVAFWNRGEFNGNSVSSFSTVFSPDSTFGNGNDSGLFNFDPAVNIGGTQQNFSLGTTVIGMQYVRVTIDDNYFGTVPGGDRVNFTEFQFNTVAVPEPSSLLMLGCTGVAALLVFRVKRK